MFQFTTCHESFPDFLISLRHYTVIGKQLLLSNDRNSVRWVVLGLSQDGACTDLVDLSKGATFTPPFFSLVNTFKIHTGNHQGNVNLRGFFLHPMRCTQKKIQNPCYQIRYCTKVISTGAILVSFCLQQHALLSQSMR